MNINENRVVLMNQLVEGKTFITLKRENKQNQHPQNHYIGK